MQHYNLHEWNYFIEKSTMSTFFIFYFSTAINNCIVFVQQNF